MKFVITVDDAGLTVPAETERRCIEYFRRHDVPASFFVVPCTRDGRQLSDDSDWVKRARNVESMGHDFQLHGYRHTGFEFGAPPAWMVRICGDSRQQSATQGYPEFRAEWTRERMSERLAEAIAAFQRAFHRRPQVFRAGCLAAAPPLFEVMSELGLRYDSNKVVDPRGWHYMAQAFEPDCDWDPETPPFPYRLTPGIVEIPAVSEYAWTLSEATLHHFIDLALEDMRRVDDAGGVFTLMCHLQRVGGKEGLPREVLDEIFTTARARHHAEFLTLAQLVHQIESGEQNVQSNGK